MAEQNQTKPKFRTSIGGQALIEGILMRGPEKQAIVVRSKEGLVEKVEELKLIRDRYPILGLPVLRGAVTFVDSMVRGVKALMYSADFFPEEEGEPSKLDLWLEKKLGSEKLQKLVVALAVVLSLGLTIGLFMILPTFLAGLLGRFNPERGRAQSGRVRHQADDLLRLPAPVLEAEGHSARVPVPRRRA